MKPTPALRKRVERVCDEIRRGSMRRKAIHVGGWSNPGTFESHLRNFPELRVLVRQAEAARRVNEAPVRPVESMDLATFRADVLGRHTFPHQQQWVDWANDASARHILIVTAPDCSKSQTFRDHMLHTLARKPTSRMAYATHAEGRAVATVSWMKSVIEDNSMLARVAGEMRPASDEKRTWAVNRFLVRQRSFDAGRDQVDYSMLGLGAQSQVAGARLDLFVVDDIDGKDSLTPGERYAIFERIITVYKERLGPSGRLVVICNRWDENDVAGHIIAHEQENPGLWKIRVSPAIIRERDKEVSGDWGEVIWPERFGLPVGFDTTASVPANGPWTHKRAWEYFEDLRTFLSPRRFALRYQNKPGSDVQKDFTDEVIAPAKARGADVSLGSVPVDSLVIAGMDPASVGGAGFVTLAIRPDGRMQLVDLAWGTNRRDAGLREWIREQRRWGVRHWAIEAQGGFKTWAEGDDVQSAVREAGAVAFTPSTNWNKHTEDVGVSSLVPVVRDLLIIPQATEEDRARCKVLLDHLASYRPPQWVGGRMIKTSMPYDLLMALWVAVRMIREKGLVPKVGADTMAWLAPHAGVFSTAGAGGSWAAQG